MTTLDIFGKYTKIPSILCELTDIVDYGWDMGGCVPRGNLSFSNNYLLIPNDFYDICKNTSLQTPPIVVPNVSISNNAISGIADVPSWILRQAGAQ